VIDIAALAYAAVLAAAETGSSGSGSQIVVAALGAGSIGAVIAALVTGLFTKRKLGAEATEIITKAASGVVESLNGEIVRVNAAMVAVRAEQAEERTRHAEEMSAASAKFQREITARDRVLQLHVAWDMLVRAKLAEHGIELPEPPPLRPPLPGFPSE